MDISYNETFREVSTNLQRIIDINTAQYRRFQQRGTIGYIEMGQRYTNYLLQNVIIEFAIIFIQYLMSLHTPNVSNLEESRQIEDPSSNTIPRNNTILRDYFFSYTFDPIINNITANTIGTRPTEQQISLATESILYDPSGNQTECPITLERFQPEEQVCRIIPCGHIFKSASLQRWFRRNVRCPVCRYDIRDYRPENIHEEDEDEYADLPNLIDDPNPSFIETRYNIYDLSLNSQRTGRTGFLNRANTSNIRTYINNFNHRIQENQPIVNEIVNNIINNQIDEPAVNELVTSFMDIFRQTR